MEYIPLLDLWLPILLSAVAIFIVSAIVWTALPHHRNDWKGLPNEDALMNALRGTPPGHYGFPWAGPEGWKDPAHQAKRAAGPVGWLTVLPSGNRGMGPMLVQSFTLYLVIAIFAAYLASRTIAPGAHYLTVFRLTATVAFLANGLAAVHDAIWFGRGWSQTFKHLADSLVYGLVTGGIFGTFWPGN